MGEKTKKKDQKKQVSKARQTGLYISEETVQMLDELVEIVPGPKWKIIERAISEYFEKAKRGKV